MNVREFLIGHLGPSIQLTDAARQALGDPALRQALLKEIHGRLNLDASGLLLEILSMEAADRASGDNPDFYENLYHCAFLIHRLGRVEDVLPLWRAKNANFETGAGFDIQFLVGAGVAPTTAFLEARTDAESQKALSYIKDSAEAGDFDALKEWAEWRDGYFRDSGGPS